MVLRMLAAKVCVVYASDTVRLSWETAWCDDVVEDNVDDDADAVVGFLAKIGHLVARELTISPSSHIPECSTPNTVNYGVKCAIEVKQVTSGKHNNKMRFTGYVIGNSL